MKYYDLDKLISTTEIARLVGVGVQAVSNWKVRYPDFPQPVWRDFYDRDEIVRWLGLNPESPVFDETSEKIV